jgi:hypothetical protein
MDKIRVNFNAKSSSPDLVLTVKLNSETQFFSSLNDEFKEIEFFMQEIDGDYLLEFELSGKTLDHTVIDDTGEILNDHTIEIENLTIDDIELGQVFLDNSMYCHDFNGTKEPVEDKFFGTMGCNGVVKFKFSCPFYMWLLENM